MKDPELVVYAGPMFAGKTTRMIMDLDRAVRQGRKVIAFKPSIDMRYGRDEIVTHNDKRFPAHEVSSGIELLKYLTDDDEVYDTVALDEMFMVPGSASALKWLFAHGMNVIVATLDLSHSGQAFDEVKEILPFATKVEKLAAVCAVTGRDAYYTYMKDDGDGEQIRVGGDELYEPRCWGQHPGIKTIGD